MRVKNLLKVFDRSDGEGKAFLGLESEHMPSQDDDYDHDQAFGGSILPSAAADGDAAAAAAAGGGGGDNGNSKGTTRSLWKSQQVGKKNHDANNSRSASSSPPPPPPSSADHNNKNNNNNTNSRVRQMISNHNKVKPASSNDKRSAEVVVRGIGGNNKNSNNDNQPRQQVQQLFQQQQRQVQRDKQQQQLLQQNKEPADATSLSVRPSLIGARGMQHSSSLRGVSGTNLSSSLHAAGLLQGGVSGRTISSSTRSLSGLGDTSHTDATDDDDDGPSSSHNDTTNSGDTTTNSSSHSSDERYVQQPGKRIATIPDPAIMTNRNAAKAARAGSRGTATTTTTATSGGLLGRAKNAVTLGRVVRGSKNDASQQSSDDDSHDIDDDATMEGAVARVIGDDDANSFAQFTLTPAAAASKRQGNKGGGKLSKLLEQGQEEEEPEEEPSKTPTPPPPAAAAASTSTSQVSQSSLAGQSSTVLQMKEDNTEEKKGVGEKAAEPPSSKANNSNHSNSNSPIDRDDTVKDINGGGCGEGDSGDIKHSSGANLKTVKGRRKSESSIRLRGDANKAIEGDGSLATNEKAKEASIATVGAEDGNRTVGKGPTQPDYYEFDEPTAPASTTENNRRKQLRKQPSSRGKVGRSKSDRPTSRDPDNVARSPTRSDKQRQPGSLVRNAAKQIDDRGSGHRSKPDRHGVDRHKSDLADKRRRNRRTPNRPDSDADPSTNSGDSLLGGSTSNLSFMDSSIKESGSERKDRNEDREANRRLAFDKNSYDIDRPTQRRSERRAPTGKDRSKESVKSKHLPGSDHTGRSKSDPDTVKEHDPKKPGETEESDPILNFVIDTDYKPTVTEEIFQILRKSNKKETAKLVDELDKTGHSKGSRSSKTKSPRQSKGKYRKDRETSTGRATRRASETDRKSPRSPKPDPIEYDFDDLESPEKANTTSTMKRPNDQRRRGLQKTMSDKSLDNDYSKRFGSRKARRSRPFEAEDAARGPDTTPFVLASQTETPSASAVDIVHNEDKPNSSNEKSNQVADQPDESAEVVVEPLSERSQSPDAVKSTVDKPTDHNQAPKTHDQDSKSDRSPLFVSRTLAKVYTPIQQVKSSPPTMGTTSRSSPNVEQYEMEEDSIVAAPVTPGGSSSTPTQHRKRLPSLDLSKAGNESKSSAFQTPHTPTVRSTSHGGARQRRCSFTKGRDVPLLIDDSGPSDGIDSEKERVDITEASEQSLDPVTIHEVDEAKPESKGENDAGSRAKDNQAIEVAVTSQHTANSGVSTAESAEKPDINAVEAPSGVDAIRRGVFHASLPNVTAALRPGSGHDATDDGAGANPLFNLSSSRIRANGGDMDVPFVSFFGLVQDDSQRMHMSTTRLSALKEIATENDVNDVNDVHSHRELSESDDDDDDDRAGANDSVIAESAVISYEAEYSHVAAALADCRVRIQGTVIDVLDVEADVAHLREKLRELEET